MATPRANCKSWPKCGCILRGNFERDCSNPLKAVARAALKEKP